MSGPTATTPRSRLNLLERAGIARLLAPAGPDRDGRLVLWWLGQAGFALRCGEQLLLIDPYLSDSLAEKHADGPFPHDRLVPVPVDPDAVTACAWVLCTHGHTDHMDPVTLHALERAARPRVLVPRAEVSKALERGARPERLTTIDAGEDADLGGGVSVHAVASAHEHLEIDDRGRHRYLGYVIAAAGARVYHSGDCVPYPGLAERLAELDVDVALLPVNGRDERRLARGVPGNFTAREAVELCRAAGIPVLVPHHFGMFAFNTVDPEALAAELEARGAGVRIHLLELGAAYEIRLPDARP